MMKSYQDELRKKAERLQEEGVVDIKLFPVSPMASKEGNIAECIDAWNNATRATPR